MSLIQDEGEQDRCAALFALVNRFGGAVTIPENELPTRDYVIMRRRTDAGELQIRIVEDGLAS